MCHSLFYPFVNLLCPEGGFGFWCITGLWEFLPELDFNIFTCTFPLFVLPVQAGKTHWDHLFNYCCLWKKKRVTFGYMMKSWKFDWWNSVDFTLNLNPCILTYTWFIHKGKSEMSLNVLQFEFEPLFCDEYTWAQVKCHWRIWDMKGYIKSYLNQFDKIFSSFLQLYINWHLESWM